MGTLGGNTIGEAPYREVPATEDLSVERRARNGGLIPVANDGVLRSRSRFLGLPVLRLHYKIFRRGIEARPA